MRYLWKGSISFGLINIPVGLYPATVDHELKFTLLHKKDLSEIRYARICKEEEKEVPYDQIVKGFKKNGHYAVMTEEDFAKAENEKSRAIEIVTFCDDSDVNPIYYQKPYFIKAEKGGAKTYFLLQHALKKAHKVAIVRYTFKNHHHVGVIKPYGQALMLNQMRFHSQILPLEALDISEKVKVSAAELKIAQQLIEQLSGPFEAEKFHDSYVEDLQKTIGKKHKGPAVKAQKKEEAAKVYDIMSLLKASLEKKKEPVKRKRASKS